MWPNITDSLRVVRNAVVHDGATATPEEARVAIEAAQLLLDEVVRPLSDELGFTLEDTGKWSEIGRYGFTKTFARESPFKR